MPVSKANQRAVNKYKKNNYDRMEIVVPKGTRETIKVHAEAHSESVNGFIKRAIADTMERDNGGIPPEAARAGVKCPSGPEVVSLPSETLETAKRASEVAGEALSDFVARAVETQAKRDQSSLRLGINPATGGKLKKEA